MATPTIPVLLDTDIGSDIDDAVCLAYLLRQPACELVGITTVHGDTLKRAALARAVCEAAGRTDVPVHVGAPGPLHVGPVPQAVHQYEAIAARPHQLDFPRGSALEFMRQTIRSRPGEITLLAIGPMTNVALLFALDPQIPSLLKQLVLMCGVFTSVSGHGPGETEYNAWCDPTAAAMVYASGPPLCTSIGLDVTMQCKLGAPECRARFTRAGGPLQIVADMAEVWFRGTPQITFHDPLAAAVIFQPTLCDYEHGSIHVETHSPQLGGLTRFKRDANTPHRIATRVRADAFFDEYFQVVENLQPATSE